IADLAERGLDHPRAFGKPVDRAGGEQPRFLARIVDAVLVGLHLGDLFLQLRMFAAQPGRGFDDLLKQSGHVRTADGHFPAADGNGVERSTLRRVDRLPFHSTASPRLLLPRNLKKRGYQAFKILEKVTRRGSPGSQNSRGTLANISTTAGRSLIWRSQRTRCGVSYSFTRSPKPASIPLAIAKLQMSASEYMPPASHSWSARWSSSLRTETPILRISSSSISCGKPW